MRVRITITRTGERKHGARRAEAIGLEEIWKSLAASLNMRMEMDSVKGRRGREGIVPG